MHEPGPSGSKVYGLILNAYSQPRLTCSCNLTCDHSFTDHDDDDDDE